MTRFTARFQTTTARLAAVIVLISLVGLASTTVFGALFFQGDDWLGRPWTILTSGFVHVNLLHLLVNTWVLVVFGWPLEREVGGRGVLGVFLAGVVAGGVPYGLVANPIPLAGASAGVAALFAAFALLRPTLRFLLFFVIPVSTRTLLYFALIVSVLGTFGELVADRPSGGIAHKAHLAGLLVGLGWARLRGTGARGAERTGAPPSPPQVSSPNRFEIMR